MRRVTFIVKRCGRLRVATELGAVHVGKHICFEDRMGGMKR